MASPYIGEIRMFAGNFAPVGWAFCDGQVMAISGNDVLFTLIGTTYGGDGVSTFALPDLRGRVPIHFGQGALLSPRTIGERAGVEDVVLATSQMPAHAHTLVATTDAGTQSSVTRGMLAASSAVALYNSNLPNVSMHAQTVGAAGGSQPHTNMQPYLGVNFIISLFGVFPSQT